MTQLDTMLMLHWIELRVVKSIQRRFCVDDSFVAKLLAVLILFPVSVLPVVIVEVMQWVHALIWVLIWIDNSSKFKLVSENLFKF